MRVVAAPDKFRGTLTAPQAARAIAVGARRAGASCTELPMADGGEGTLDAFGGANRLDRVTGPLGPAVPAPWRLDPSTGRAVIESATASGLVLAGGARGNDPQAASTRGVGELVAAAVRAGATQLLVALGGSASTDGGSGAIDAVADAGLLAAVAERDLVVCCDVRTRFTDAARVFGPQKGADEAVVRRLEDRLHALRAQYRDRFGLDPQDIEGSGAAGGLAGGLAMLGGRLVPGVDLVATENGLTEAIRAADVVITGEGRLDDSSWHGKVVGAVCERAASIGRPVLVVAGEVRGGDGSGRPDGPVTVVSLVDRYGRHRALNETSTVVEVAVADAVAGVPQRR